MDYAVEKLGADLHAKRAQASRWKETVRGPGREAHEERAAVTYDRRDDEEDLGADRGDMASGAVAPRRVVESDEEVLYKRGQKAAGVVGPHAALAHEVASRGSFLKTSWACSLAPRPR